MAKDFLKKEPTKTERLLYELAMHQEMIDRNTHSNSAHLLALGILLGVNPEKMAELLVSGDDKLKAYGTQINEAIDKLKKEKKAEDKGQESHLRQGFGGQAGIKN